MVQICRTTEEVDAWWLEFELMLAADINRVIEQSEIDVYDFKEEIYLLKCTIGEELSRENRKLVRIFLDYREERMSVNFIKQYFFERYEYYLLMTKAHIKKWKNK